MNNERKIKDDAGYVQVEAFERAHEGYFCGTCRALRWEGDKDGFCTALRVPVRTYGCCNLWKLSESQSILGADGRRLRVV